MIEKQWLTTSSPLALLNEILNYDRPHSFDAYHPESARPAFLNAMTARKLDHFALLVRRYFGKPKSHEKAEIAATATILCHDGWSDPYFTQGRKCDLLRDMFGNPWQPIGRPGKEMFAIDPVQGRYPLLLEDKWLAWEDNTIPKIVQKMLSDDDYQAMPILGDAFEEAGCPTLIPCRYCAKTFGGPFQGTQPRSCLACHDTMRIMHPILAHCRLDKIHCQECWLLQLISP